MVKKGIKSVNVVIEWPLRDFLFFFQIHQAGSYHFYNKLYNLKHLILLDAVQLAAKMHKFEIMLAKSNANEKVTFT